MPRLVEMREKYAERGLIVVGLTKDEPDRTAWFAGHLDATYPLLARAAADFESYGVVWVPVVYLVDPQGRVVADDLDAIEARLARELGPAPG